MNKTFVESRADRLLNLKVVKLPGEKETLLILGWIWTTKPFFHATSKSRQAFRSLTFHMRQIPPTRWVLGVRRAQWGRSWQLLEQMAEEQHGASPLAVWQSRAPGRKRDTNNVGYLRRSGTDCYTFVFCPLPLPHPPPLHTDWAPSTVSNSKTHWTNMTNLDKVVGQRQ